MLEEAYRMIGVPAGLPGLGPTGGGRTAPSTGIHSALRSRALPDGRDRRADAARLLAGLPEARDDADVSREGAGALEAGTGSPTAAIMRAAECGRGLRC